MILKFTKMHGTGNDFVVVDDRAAAFKVTAERAKLILDRRFGVGGDQLLVLRNCPDADMEMRIYNADGSEVEMCGNGIRCAALYARSRGIVSKNDLTVKTLAGIIRPTIVGGLVRVDMGIPQFDGPKIPVNLQGEIIDRPIEIDGRSLLINCVSMGNPHCVIYVTDLDNAPVGTAGPELERHPMFPNRVNVEFAQVISRSEIRMRVWERGSGETMACGTGACAAAVMSVRKGLVDREVTVHLRGGDLIINLNDSGRVIMTGPAAEVYRGEMNLQG